MNVTVLGSTGSIGVSTLDVVRRLGGRCRVYALVAGRNVDVLCSQILEFRPAVAVVADETALHGLIGRLSESPLSRREWPDLAVGDAARISAAVAPEVDF